MHHTPRHDRQRQKFSGHQDLQQIVGAKQAHIKAQPNQFEHTATPSDTSSVQQVPRVQIMANMHIPHANANRRLKRSMNMTTPFSRVLITSTPNNKPTASPTDSVRWEQVRKRHAAWLQSADPTINTSPCIRTQAQVAMTAAQVAPLALSTHLHSRYATLPPLSHHPGFAAAITRQQQHQHSMVCLTWCISQLENKVHQELAVMDADTGKLLNYRQLMRSMKYKKAWSLSSANKFEQLANGISGRIKKPPTHQHEVPKEWKQDVRYGKFVCTV